MSDALAYGLPDVGKKDYTPKEIADRFGVSTAAVYLWLRSYKLEGIRNGKRWLIPQKAVERFVEGIHSDNSYNDGTDYLRYVQCMSRWKGWSGGRHFN